MIMLLFNSFNTPSVRVLNLLGSKHSCTWFSGIMCLSVGLELKKEDKGEGTSTGSGLAKPLRSQLGTVMSCVFMTRVSMA